VSTGLLAEHCRRRKPKPLLAHEVSHVANGDMVTLTLIQGVSTTFVILPGAASSATRSTA